MKRNAPFLYIFSFLACLAFISGTGAPSAFAAKAQNPPVAQKAPEAKKPPVAQKQPKARPKVAPRQNTAHLTSIESSGPRKPAQAAKTPAAGAKSQPAPRAVAGDTLKDSLDVFAKDCLVRMNKQRRPSISHKEVVKQPDGTFMARYMVFDADSLETSYNPTDNNKTIKYIGRMNYHEVEYVCKGKDQKQALAGPFNESNRTPVTELIKYKAGKWTY